MARRCIKSLALPGYDLRAIASSYRHLTRQNVPGVCLRLFVVEWLYMG